MTKTVECIESVQKFGNELQEYIADREVILFEIGDVKVEKDKLMLDDISLSKKATSKILGNLKVKPDFLKLSGKMTERDWLMVAEKLKQTSSSQKVFGKKKKSNNEFSDIFLSGQKNVAGGIHFEKIFDMISQSLLESSSDNLSLHNAFFIEKRDEAVLDIIDTEKIFENGLDDPWKIGNRISFTGLEFDISPFFLRQVCTNGNVAPQFGFKADASKKKYNTAKLGSILKQFISEGLDIHSPLLLNAIRHISNINISVEEFLKFRSLFDEEENYEILKKHFSMDYLYNAYQCPVDEMHRNWKITADSGKNAYDFFNDITYIASHPDEYQIDELLRRDLQIKSSSLLFKPSFDLELIAPKVSFN